MARMSIATIDKPEFINITPCNPLISQCEIKVMYVGENRNKSYITKEVATKMANTLPGCPIVGYFREDKKDFADHGDRVVIDDTGLHFECMTRPYGFVAPNAKVWFQKFEDIDDLGNSTIREYLMTTGYLWTGQYPECQVAVDEGRPHSMELDKDTLDGEWAKNYNKKVDFFIINDAIFSKLCVLGEDIEPCFEESSITAPEISASFTKVDEKFTKTLYAMMEELKFALKGEQKMVQDKTEKDLVVENQISTEESVETSFASKEDEDKKEAAKEEKASEGESKSEPEKEDDEDKKKYAKSDDEEEDKKDDVEDKEDKTSEDKDDKKEDEDEKKKYALLQEEHNSLLDRFSALENRYNELLAFKNQVEDEKKDSLINSFYMLSAEDKQEVIENKSKYSLEDIEAKLSVICFRKKVNFDLDDTDKIENKTDEQPAITFSLDEQASSAPAWIAALRNTRNNRNI